MKTKSQEAFALSDEDDRPDIWQRLSRVLVTVLFLLVMAVILSLFLPEVEKQREIDSELAELEGVRDAMRERRQKLAARLEWMKTEPEYLEAIARDRLDLFKPGELILRIERAPDGSATLIED